MRRINSAAEGQSSRKGMSTTTCNGRASVTDVGLDLQHVRSIADGESPGSFDVIRYWKVTHCAAAHSAIQYKIVEKISLAFWFAK